MKVIEGDIVAQVEEAMAFVWATEISEWRRKSKDNWHAKSDGNTRCTPCARESSMRYAIGTTPIAEMWWSRFLTTIFEIWNPGSLPLDLTVEDLRKSHRIEAAQ